MKKLFALITLVATILTACDISQLQNMNEDLTIIPFSNDNQRYGLVDLKGNIIVENEWERPSSIATDGIVRVKNKDGNFEYFSAISNPQKIGVEYKDATLFSEGLAAVVNEQGFIHYIDKQGNIKFELPDDGRGSPVQKAGVFSEGLARFQNSENLWGFIDKNGNIVIKPKYDYVNNFKEGVALVERYNRTTNEKSIGFVNKEDVEVIPLSDRFTAFSDFNEGLAACTDKDAMDQWGYINMNGDKVIEINRLRVNAMPFQGSHAAFFDGSYWGLIDRKGEIVVNPKYDGLLAFYFSGLGPYKNSSNEIGFISHARKEIIKCQFEEILPFFSNTTVVRDKYYIFIDKQGNSVSKTYLKYIPTNDIKNQFMNYKNDLVRSLYVNTNSVADAIIKSISSEAINDLSFNSSVIDVINFYKIPKNNLPKNSYQKYIQSEIALPGNLDPYRIRIQFNEPIFTDSRGSNELEINNRARIKSIEFRVFTSALENGMSESIVDQLISKIENSNYYNDNENTNTRLKPNTSIYRSDRTIIMVNSNATEINLKIDYSEYF